MTYQQLSDLCSDGQDHLFRIRHNGSLIRLTILRINNHDELVGWNISSWATEEILKEWLDEYKEGNADWHDAWKRYVQHDYTFEHIPDLLVMILL